MALSSVPFGPGTITIGDDPTVVDFSCEVLGGSIAHEYSEVGESRTMLCGTKRSSSRTRADSVKLTLENDLTTAGIYAYCQGLGENPGSVTVTFTPNTANAAEWSGRVFPLLPGEIGSDEYGSPIGSEVEWPADGLLTFTPAVAVP